MVKFGMKQGWSAYAQEEQLSTIQDASQSSNVEMDKFGIQTHGNANVSLPLFSTVFTVSQILVRTEEFGTMIQMFELVSVQKKKFGILEPVFHQELTVQMEEFGIQPSMLVLAQWAPSQISTNVILSLCARTDNNTTH